MKKYIICAGMAVILMGVVLVAQLYYVSKINKQPETAPQRNEITNWAKPDGEELEYYEIGMFKTHLPVLYVNTNGHQISKEEKVWATLAVMEALPEGGQQAITQNPDYEVSITINYRGASSYSQFDKKQYRIKFFKEEGSANAVNYEFLGMGANSEWVLNGPFLDKTLIRNRLAYGLGREIFEWAPDSRYVELFVNGQYKGVYLAVEPVTNGESRLRLADFGLSNGSTAYIIKRDRVDTEEGALNTYGYYGGKTSNSLYIDYPTKNNITEIQREWITKDIDEFEKVLYGENFADPKEGYAKYIDVDSFVNYYVFNEVMMNQDAGNLSTYIYKELESKLQIAIWDYNNCYDNYQWFAMDYESFFVKEAAWFSRLLEDRAFVDKVVQCYKEMRQTTFNEAYMYQQIDKYIEELGDAKERNFAIWGYSFNNKLVVDTNEFHINPRSYDEAIKQLKKAINKRLLFLDSNITDLYQKCIN